MDPQFVHDCPDCTFLGCHDKFDLYHCRQHGIPTVIARYGSDGPEYISGMNVKHPALIEAKKRAMVGQSD